ncbi:hypothetical protein AN6148.2 [Aspergillus nidulans FGSC A4]|uniref:Carboxylic ester hydrolase n=1 Tax=Emericella nidulans (strain FGSC A4 / ATCC 38163 / CBS 112.46 / NRRL 194 / M139) TaxID=227321 RepID=Q5AZY2_EMENI|nr:hypothetical protein [Aspergillus nidulans FGSC A4]EAA57934.1 hypothetical protein AN6148.2 [Aspergillus nidulans FGSC A4]CBF70087.1 TPA: carboxylesterase, putative (AFU_orthologue; AFUA_2G08500) [Aspergillus nidulans FGSC A4]|eukprot:XP_663752.1 hypothetical protein AN6148.2 [Aspergillus nidulans FGSC A4]
MGIPHYFSALSALTFLLTTVIGGTNAATNSDPLIHLTYGSFQGRYDSTYNISYFRKIPFAAPPTGENRFCAPQPPLPVRDGIYDTDQSFDMCPQRTVNGSEDCLYLVIYPNYRVNAFGFLPGKAVKDSPTSDLNPGLLDQEYALKWIQDHIAHFGGDPRNVTIWGQSAGGGSVVAQVAANGRRGRKRLFSKALASSPFWPKTYRYDDYEAEVIYDSLVNLTGCAGENDSLVCLKRVDVQAIRDANQIISASHKYTTSSYTWAPVIDDEFLLHPLTEATSHSLVETDYIFATYNTHEGENFIPPGFAYENTNATSDSFNSSSTSFRSWLSGFLPGLSPSQILTLEHRYYPETGQTETMDLYNSTYVRAGLVYRDVVLSCPGYWLASAARQKGYLAEYTIPPAQHADDTAYVCLLLAPFLYSIILN